MPPVVYGESSGTTALPSSALTIGAPRMSATCSSSSPAPIAPCPASMTGFLPPLSSDAALLSDSACGTTMGGVQALDVCPLTFIGEGDPSEADFSCQSLQHVMCATPRAPSAARQAASTREWACAGPITC